MATINLESFIREETLRSIENKSVDLQVSAVNYVNQFFSKISPMEIKSKLDECFTQDQINLVVATVPNWAEDIEGRIDRKLLDPSNTYSSDELAELYPSWMISYAITAFDSESKRKERVFKDIKREARAGAQTIEKLKEVNKALLSSALKNLPSYT